MTSFGQKWTEAEFAGNDEFLVKHVEKKIVEHFLQNHQKLLLDNTNISVESRKPYLAIAHQTGKSIGVVFLTRRSANACSAYSWAGRAPSRQSVIRRQLAQAE